MPNDTAAEKAGSAENRDNTIAPSCHGSSFLTSLMIGRAIRPIEHPIELGGRHRAIPNSEFAIENAPLPHA
jgi:hypothetical protein